MKVYLAGPNTQQQAEHLTEMPVLLSFAYYSPWVDQYQSGFSRILIDSGAFSEFNTGQKIDLGKYREWSQRWIDHADAIAGLDNISGDWRQGIKNLECMPWAFPTIHEADPIEVLPELVAIAQERKSWIGIGLTPPRTGKESLIRRICEHIPEDIHIHGWALRGYTNIRRLDSVDSTNWWRDAMKIRRDLPWLNYGEALEIVVKRYQRETRQIFDPMPDGENGQMVLSDSFGLVGAETVLDSVRPDTEGQRRQ